MTYLSAGVGENSRGLRTQQIFRFRVPVREHRHQIFGQKTRIQYHHLPAELEREPVPERTNADGQPTPLSPDTLRTARRLFEQRDMTVAQIGEVLGVDRSIIYRVLRKYRSK